MNIIKIEHKIENDWLVTRVYATDKDWFTNREGDIVYWNNAVQNDVVPDIYETRVPLMKVNA